MPQTKHHFELPNKSKLRNLAQYKNLTEAEFEEKWAQIVTDAVPSAQLEKRIELKLAEFENDYDLSDLKINDRLVLRALIQAIIQLEDLEQMLFKFREEGLSQEKVALVRDINSVMTQLRKDISSMQGDLNITRKARKGDKEQTVISYIEDLKLKARKFYEHSMFYVFCPECNALLSTMWFANPEGRTQIKIHCNRVLDGGEKCKGVVETTAMKLLENRGSNKDDLPESLM